MIKAFAPAYDSATKSNARLVRHVFPHEAGALVGDRATRDELHKLIASSKTTCLLIMSHGGMDSVCAQGGACALSVQDIVSDTGGVLRLPIFAWACNTSLGMGRAFHSHAKGGAGAWWGYRSTISAPCSKELAAFREILNYIADEFPRVSGEASARSFFDELRRLCQSHRTRIIHIMENTRTYANAHENAVALEHVWSLLDVWLPSIPRVVRAPSVDPILVGL